MFDRALEKFASRLFFDCHGLADFRYIAWGYAWENNVRLPRDKYPRLHASLRGWNKASPDAPRLPCRGSS